MLGPSLFLGEIMKFKLSMVSLLMVTTLTACSNSVNVPDVKASEKIEDSFSVITAKAVVEESANDATVELSPSANRTRIRILKSALEKEFLWHAEIVMQLSVPQFSGLKSRVVAFRLRGESLFMIEATPGHSITNELPQTLILAEFPVTAQDDRLVEFDFNRGLSDIYVADDWRASDYDGSGYQGAKEFISVAVKHSYIERAELNSRNELVVVQHAQIAQPQAAPAVAPLNIPVETRHYISPYISNPAYKPISTVSFDRMGFFEVAPLLAEQSVTNVYASRFDPAKEKTITFAISANTPPEYREAVREGVLYWNRAFGYEKIKVVTAPEGMTAPNSEYNIVQWVDWDAAGSAYADAQMDPRTGEIRHAQIFMTSAFAFSSLYRVRALLRQLETAKKPEPSLSVAGLQHSTLCDLDASGQLQTLLSQLAVIDLPEERILEISRDYIREVVAHEVGHTLGLRHNFAGNLSANFDISELDGVFAEYLKTLKLRENIQFSSSVMEYQNFTSSVMSGRLLAKPGEKAFSYDQKAIDVLYKDKALNPAEIPLFCTDSQKDKYIGCTVWDQGPSPLANIVYNERKYSEGLTRTLLEAIIRAKTPPFGLPVRSPEEIILDPGAVATAFLAPRNGVLQLLTDVSNDLRVHRSFVKVDPLNKSEVIQKTLQAAGVEITRLGGLKSILALPSPSLAENWVDEFNRLIESPFYREGIGYNGQPYKLSEAEVAQAKAIAKNYFAQIQAALALSDIASLATHQGALVESPLADDLAEVITNRMIEYILGESGETIQERVTLTEGKSAILKLPLYKYEQPVRIAAAKLLINRSAKMMEWGLHGHNSVKELLVTKIKSLLMDNSIEKVRADKNSHRVARWLVENKAVIAAMPSRD